MSSTDKKNPPVGSRWKSNASNTTRTVRRVTDDGVYYTSSGFGQTEFFSTHAQWMAWEASEV